MSPERFNEEGTVHASSAPHNLNESQSQCSVSKGETLPLPHDSVKSWSDVIRQRAWLLMIRRSIDSN